MPLLQELPPGREGIVLAWSSAKAVIMGVALLTYSYIGAIGAAAFGAATQGDIMLNRLVCNQTGAAALVIAVLVYIASCIPPLIVSMRCYIDFMVAGPGAGYHPQRFYATTLAIVFAPMLVAMADAGASRAAFAVTGATGVCIVCYVIPVVVHTLLRREGECHGVAWGAQDPLRCSDTHESLLPGVDRVEVGGHDAGADTRHPARPHVFSVVEDVLPWAVLVMGCAFSGLALKGVLLGFG